MENAKQEILKIIRNRRSDGLSDEQIMATLLNRGYTTEQINGLIEESYNAPEAFVDEPVAAQEQPRPKKKWWPF